MNEDIELIYLATPYSHKDPKVKQKRFDEVNRVAARLINEGYHIFSPISHAHMIAINHDLPGDWNYWEEHNKLMLSKCTKMIVLCQSGWKDSVGVSKEIDIAVQLGLHIEYIDN